MDSAVSEKSFQVLEIIAQKKEVSQRELAEATGVSLGMVNLILKRLVQTGYLKVSGLSRKKMEYILTPKGIGERMVRSYQYFLRAYRTFHETQSRVDSLVSTLLAKGEKRFVLLGDGEVSQLVDLALKSRGGPDVVVRRATQETFTAQDGEIALDCRFGTNGGAVGISVLEKILESTHN